MPFKIYLAKITAALKQGDATEHTHRPALKELLESLESDLLATNEPKRIACGAPDYIVLRKNVPLGYVEAKDVGKKLDDIEGDEQLKRYRKSLRNLILTDYLEFRLYRNGEPVQVASLGNGCKPTLVLLHLKTSTVMGLDSNSALNWTVQQGPSSAVGCPL